MFVHKQFDNEGKLLDVSLFLLPKGWEEEDAKDHVRYLDSASDGDTTWLFEQMKTSGFHKIISNA